MAELLLRVAIVLLALVGGSLWIRFVMHSLGLRRSPRLDRYQVRHPWIGLATGMSASSAEEAVGPKTAVVLRIVSVIAGAVVVVGSVAVMLLFIGMAIFTT